MEQKKYPISVDLTGKVAVITGAGGVLCSAFAEVLAQAGAKVALLDINEDAVRKVAEHIRAEGGDAVAVRADCLSRESLEEAKAAVDAAFGAADILINGAGGNNPRATTDAETFDPEALTAGSGKSFFDLSPEGFRFVFDLNVTAAVLTTQVFARDMAVSGKGGNIINISSMNAFRPLTKIPAYSAAKAAVSNLTEWLAVHFASAGIRVNAIAPGFFLTNQNRNLLLNADGSLSPRSEKILGHTPMGRFGVPEDLDGVLLWLADDKFSAFVDGVVVPVDGGFAAYSGV